ncbi:MAG TPA: succinate dehydrogenase, cytochrome b556 subunit [Burkholderiales bacterium]|nr:succinate dehydrogenase, cytochrome b556 subunit [Burkholderiales bacterium]
MSSAAAKKPRPKYLSLSALLFEIRLPVTAWASGLHRISGALLVLPFIAWLLYLLDTSLASEQGFRHVQEYLRMPVAKLGLVVFIWAFAHHFFAGIRFLLLDLNKGVDIHRARMSGYAVIVLGVLTTLLFAWRIW